MQVRAKLLGTLAMASSFFLVACGVSGTAGKLRFADEDGGGDGLVLPLAMGRSVSYTIRSATFMAPKRDVVEASSSDADVLAVTGHYGPTVTVRAKAVGRATLRVVTEDAEDEFELEVREEAMTWLFADSSETPAALDVRGAYTLQPGEALSFASPVFADAQGQRLSGSGPVEFAPAQATGSMKLELDDSSAKLTAGESGDEARADVASSGTLRVRTVADVEVKSLQATLHALLFTKTLQTGPSFSVPNGVHLLRILPVDAQGYAYIGQEPTPMTVSLEGETEFFTVAPVRVGDSTDHCVAHAPESERCIKWENLPLGAFQISTNGKETATATLEATIDGVTQTFTLTRESTTSASDESDD